jgi:hypothetical protein
MKIEVDFEDCVSAYAEEWKRSTYTNHDELKKPMQMLLYATTYERGAELVLDLLESIPEETRNRVMEERGYQRIEEKG